MKPKYYRANFLWPHKKDSVNEAGYEFANGNTEEYRKMWWKILIGRISARITSWKPAKPKKRRKQIVPFRPTKKGKRK